MAECKPGQVYDKKAKKCVMKQNRVGIEGLYRTKDIPTSKSWLKKVKEKNKGKTSDMLKRFPPGYDMKNPPPNVVPNPRLELPKFGEKKHHIPLKNKKKGSK